MKATNNLNQELKDEITELMGKVSKLQIYYDDSQEIMQKERDQMKKKFDEDNAGKDEMVKTMREERDAAKKQYEDMNKEFQMKMTQVRLMEMELEEKLANMAAENDD